MLYIFINNSFFSDYIVKTKGSGLINELLQGLDTKRQATYKNLMKTLIEKGKKEAENRVVNISESKNKLEKIVKEREIYEKQVDDKKAELNNLESNLNKKKRTLDDLSKKLKDFEENLKTFDD